MFGVSITLCHASVNTGRTPQDSKLTQWTFFDHADETQVHIAKHVLKTLCTDVTNILVNSLAADLMMSVENPSVITNEVLCRLLSVALSSRAPGTNTESSEHVQIQFELIRTVCHCLKCTVGLDPECF